MAEDPDAPVDDDAPVEDAGEVADDDEGEVAIDEEAPTSGAERPSPTKARRRMPFDARTLVICTLIALIAALVAGLVTARVLEDDEAEPGDSTLVAAQSVPDVPLERLSDGSEVSLTDFRGQALVVNFWGSWCAPCVQEMPELQRVQESLGDDVTFIGVNIRDQVDKAQQLAEETGVTYELVRDVDGELLRQLGVTIFPTTLLVLPDGTVIDSIKSQVSAEQLCDKINQSLLAGALTECG